jgi:hypothetical protein
MNIVTLAECKNRLHIDFNDSDSDIEIMANSIESSLYFATGIDFNGTIDDKVKDLAKEYVLLKLYLDYYEKHTEIDNRRLTYIMKQLQLVAHLQ